MDGSVFRWFADEAVLQAYVAGLSTIALLGIIVVCIALLSKGADWMIDGVVDLAQRTGLPKIVIGATVVSLGTTLPEAFVSVMAAYMGNPGLALGNGVGSIIADTGLIFGLTCVLAAVPVNRFILNRTGWVQVGSATLLVVIAVVVLLTASAGEEPLLGRGVGFFFLVLLAAYLYITYVWARQGTELGNGAEEDAGEELMGPGKSWTLVVGGLVLVILGARVLVPAASEIAQRLGVPDDVIAATMVAFGTSLPELMTAIAAVRKGHPEITVGNIVGADVLNVLFVIGAAAAAAPLAIPANFFYFHFPAMLIILYSFRVFISMNRTVFHRWQGAWLLSVYGTYVVLQYALNIGAAH
ncbi:MAG: sodium:calcium antiporter [Pseudomonadota bacterium]